MLYVRKVTGQSMQPTLQDGQLVLFRYANNFVVGQVVLAKLLGKEAVKRISKIEGEKVWLQGDNSLESTDSREYGPVTKKDVHGVILYPRL